MKYYLIFNDKHPNGLVCNELQLSQAKLNGGHCTIVEVSEDEETQNLLQTILNETNDNCIKLERQATFLH